MGGLIPIIIRCSRDGRRCLKVQAGCLDANYWLQSSKEVGEVTDTTVQKDLSIVSLSGLV